MSDRRSLRSKPTASIDGISVPVQPADIEVNWEDALSIPITHLTGTEPAICSFHSRLEIDLLGTRELKVASVGQNNLITIKGNWPHPSFQGPPLPSARTVSPGGFSATWETTEFARGLPRQMLIPANGTVPSRELATTTTGVLLIEPIDAYRVVERSLKYGVLFIVIVFTLFLLFEILGEKRIHPMQYFFVGTSLALFFLGFLALSEIWGATGGYAAAAVAVTLLVIVYARSILGGGKAAHALGVGLVLAYGYLFFVLQSENFALVAGVVALFVLLSGVMWTTRKIDWYRMAGNTRAEPTEEMHSRVKAD